MDIKTGAGMNNLYDELLDDGVISDKAGKKRYEKPLIVIEEYEMTNICSLSGGANSLLDGWDF